MNDSLVSNENLSLDYVFQLFNNAFFEIERKENTLVVRNNTNVWIDIDSKNQRFLSFSCFYRIDENKGPSLILNFVNKINTNFILVKTGWEETSINIQYFLWVEYGVTPRNIISSYKFFDSVLVKAVVEEDTEGIFL